MTTSATPTYRDLADFCVTLGQEDLADHYAGLAVEKQPPTPQDLADWYATKRDHQSRARAVYWQERAIGAPPETAAAQANQSLPVDDWQTPAWFEDSDKEIVLDLLRDCPQTFDALAAMYDEAQPGRGSAATKHTERLTLIESLYDLIATGDVIEQDGSLAAK